MSEKFGLDWQKYGSKRMQQFIEILAAINIKEEKDARHIELKSKALNSNGRRR